MELLFIHSFNRESSSGSGSFPSNKCSWIDKCSGINWPRGLAVATPFRTLPKLMLSLWHLLPTLDREMLVNSKVILNLVLVDRSSGFKILDIINSNVDINCSKNIFDKLSNVDSCSGLNITSSKMIIVRASTAKSISTWTSLSLAED